MTADGCQEVKRGSVDGWDRFGESSSMSEEGGKALASTRKPYKGKNRRGGRTLRRESRDKVAHLQGSKGMSEGSLLKGMWKKRGDIQKRCCGQDFALAKQKGGGRGALRQRRHFKRSKWQEERGKVRPEKGPGCMRWGPKSTCRGTVIWSGLN